MMLIAARRLLDLSCVSNSRRKNFRFARFKFSATILLLLCAATAQSQTAGSLDVTFDGDGRASLDVETLHNHAFAVMAQPDGKIILAGSVQMTAGNTDFGLVRYHSNGALDTSFGLSGKATTDFGSPNDFAAAVAMQPDGKIVVAGRAMLTPLMGTNLKYFDFALARYHTGLTVERRAAFDFDGDGRADISVYRNGTWFLQQTTEGLRAFEFGLASDRLAAADYDGDGRMDAAVFRAGVWYIARSQASFYSMPFGLSSDVPVPAAYVP